MDFNTVKTTLGFVFTWAEGLLPISLRRGSISSIYNLHEIDGLVHTSGQPTERQLRSIRDSGVTTVLNLAPHQAENALADEKSVVTDLNMQYLHMPVNFKHPSDDDFAQFCQYMEKYAGDKLWVHCAANMRVSAFIYRYRVQVLQVEPQVAAEDLNEIWQPFGVWRKFINKATQSQSEKEA